MTVPRPGAGAREQHHRRTAARLRRLRAAGASHEELVAALDDETPSERAWRVGAEGEERLGSRLNEWARTTGFGVLHDLEIPGSGGANIDHVVIGLSGITVIDAKTWSGPVSIRSSGVWTGGFGHRRDLDGIARQVATVRELLGDGRAVPVRGVLCLVNENRGAPTSELLRVGPVVVGRPALVAGFAAAGGPLAATRCGELFTALHAGLRVRGGALPPSEILRGASCPPVRDAPASPRSGRAASHGRTPSVPRAARDRTSTSRRAIVVALVQLACIAMALLIMVAAIAQLRTSATPQRRDAALTSAEMRSWLPALGRRVRMTTTAPLGDPRVKITANRFHVRLAGGGCKLRVSVNRWTARSADDAVIVPGPGC